MMMIFVRIDDRLVHGQVMEGWVNFLRATAIYVADDSVSENQLQRSIMEISAPQGLALSVGGVDAIIDEIRAAAGSPGRAILLFSNPADVLRAVNAGMPITAVNLGGMHYVPGKRKLMDVLAVDENDLRALRDLMHRGIKIEIQTVPTAKPKPIEKVFAACGLS